MTKERNALAELANELTWIEHILRDEGYGAYCADANKANRIIAELAKITLNGVGWPVRLELADAYEKCRAIAEEGEYNGNE